MDVLSAKLIQFASFLTPTLAFLWRDDFIHNCVVDLIFGLAQSFVGLQVFFQFLIEVLNGLLAGDAMGLKGSNLSRVFGCRQGQRLCPDGWLSIDNADSLLALSELAAAGLGRAVLPCFLGEGDARLRRLEFLPDVQSELWLLTHADLRGTARVRAFMEHMAAGLLTERALLEGELPMGQNRK